MRNGTAAIPRDSESIIVERPRQECERCYRADSPRKMFSSKSEELNSSLVEMNALTRLSVKSERIIIAPRGRGFDVLRGGAVRNRVAVSTPEMGNKSHEPKATGPRSGRTANISIYRAYKT